MEFTINSRESRGVAVLDLKGRLVLGKACDSLRQQVVQLLAGSQKKILLNMADAERVDSCGIGTLVEAVILAAKEGGALKLVNLPQIVRNTLVVHRLLQAFEVYDNEEQALASFGPPG